MAFMGIFFMALIFAAVVFVIMLIGYIVLTLVFFITTAVLKTAGKKEKSKELKIAGNVFLVPGILLSIPLIAAVIFISFHVVFAKVTLPGGETEYVRRRNLSKMDSYLENPDANSLHAMEELLDKDSNLVFYHDMGGKSVLDDGLEIGNADVVRIVLEHGAIFDNPERYVNMEYLTYANSMDYYVDSCIGRVITDDDVEIVKTMFANNVSTEIEEHRIYYSNMFGKAVWTVLYNNDEMVTDTELEWIQIFIDNGLFSDTRLLLMEELSTGYRREPKYHSNVTKNSNYNQLMDILGK